MSKGQIPWARVFAEFLAILAGVTVALPADDWRDYRNDRSGERVALEEILRDLETDSLELAAQHGRMRALGRTGRPGVSWERWVQSETAKTLADIRHTTCCPYLRVLI
jgi:hypothetical protein